MAKEKPSPGFNLPEGTRMLDPLTATDEELQESDIIFVGVDAVNIPTLEVSLFLVRLAVLGKRAWLTFNVDPNDPREVWQMPAVRTWCRIFNELPIAPVAYVALADELGAQREEYEKLEKIGLGRVSILVMAGHGRVEGMKFILNDTGIAKLKLLAEVDEDERRKRN